MIDINELFTTTSYVQVLINKQSSLLRLMWCVQKVNILFFGNDFQGDTKVWPLISLWYFLKNQFKEKVILKTMSTLILLA